MVRPGIFFSLAPGRALADQQAILGHSGVSWRYKRESSEHTHYLGEESLITPQSMAYGWRKAQSALEVTRLTSAAGACPLLLQCPEPCD